MLPAPPPGVAADPLPSSLWLDSTPMGAASAEGRLPDPQVASTLRALQRQQGPLSLRTLALALVQTPGSTREAQAWAEETRGFDGADALQAVLGALPDEVRLPLFEWALHLLAATPLPDRAELLKSARRVMCADGKVRPIDRLRWLLMRHLLSGQARPQAVKMPHARPEVALADLPESRRLAIARFSAYVARMVPLTDPIAKVGSAGVAWYRSVMRHCWLDGAPPCQVPDTDAFGHALADLQQLSWVQRPVLVRLWVQAGLKMTHQLWPGEPLMLDAAEALRIATTLLDSPVPGSVAGRFVALPGDGGPVH